MLTSGARRLVSRPGAICSALALLGLSVLAGAPTAGEIVAIAVILFGLSLLAGRIARTWYWLVAGVAIVDLLIPEDGRYSLRGVSKIGFQLEPYRLLIAIIVIGWVAALLVDPRVRPRKTKFDGPIALIWVAIIGSELFNITRATDLSTWVVKAFTVNLCLILFVYVCASVVRTREAIEFILRVIVGAACVVAVAAMFERETTFNLFNHLHRLLPIFSFNAEVQLAVDELRNGHFRALASAGHPIELSNEMAMVVPIAIYLAVAKNRKWWAAVLVLLMGDLSAGSRTGIIGLLVVTAVFLWMRPRQTVKFWPAVIPLLAVVYVLSPGAISGAVNSFFPKGGLVAQQSNVFYAYGQKQQASRLSRLGPQLHDLSAHYNLLFGEGFGTRIVGRSVTEDGVSADNAQILDDQWLGNTLDTGLVGFAAWLWLFARVIRQLRVRAKQEGHIAEGWLPVALAAAVMCYAVSMFFYDAFGFLQATVILYLLYGCASALLWLPAEASAARQPVQSRLLKDLRLSNPHPAGSTPSPAFPAGL